MSSHVLHLPHQNLSLQRYQELKAELSAQKELIAKQQQCIDRFCKDKAEMQQRLEQMDTDIADVSALPFRFCVFISLLTQPFVFTFVLLLAAERVSAVIGRGPALPFTQHQRGTDT